MKVNDPSAGDLKIPEDLLRAFLSDRDVRCPQCEYDLRNLLGSRCPECGEEIVLRVNLAEPKQALLIAGLVGLSAGAGFNGLLLLFVVISNLIRDRSGPDRETLATIAIGMIVEGGALAIWLHQWCALRRLSTKSRTFLMLACWGLSLLDLVVFSVIVR